MSVVRSEWIKLRSLRSVLWTSATVLVLMASLGALFSFGKAHELAVSGTAADRAAFDPTAASLSGMLLAQIAVACSGCWW